MSLFYDYSSSWHWRWYFIAKIPLLTAFHKEREIFRLFWCSSIAKNTQKKKRKSCVFCLSLISILMNRFSTSSVFLSFFERVCWLWSVYTDKSTSKSTIVPLSLWKHTQTCTYTLTQTHTYRVQSRANMGLNTMIM